MLFVGVVLVVVYYRVRHGHLRPLRPLFFWIEDTGGDLNMELR